MLENVTNQGAVPIYDARDNDGPLIWSDLPSLEPNDLEKNMAVLVVFTSSRFLVRRDSINDMPFGCSLNVQKVAVLANPDNNEEHTFDCFFPEAAGLDLRYTPRLSDNKASVPTALAAQLAKMEEEEQENIHALKQAHEKRRFK